MAFIKTITVLLAVSTVLATDNGYKPNIYSIGAHLYADSLSKTLRSTANEFLAIPEIQNVIDTLPFHSAYLDEQHLDEITFELSEVLSRYRASLSSLRNFVSNTSSLPPSLENYAAYKALPNCADLINVQTHRPSNTSCTVTHDPVDSTRAPDKNVSNVFSSNTLPGTASQFLISRSGFHLEYPIRPIPHYQKTHWQQYVAGLGRPPTSVVIVIELAPSDDTASLLKMRSVARILLEAAVDGDEYVVLTNEEEIISCQEKLKDVHWKTREQLNDFVHGINIPSDNTKLGSRLDLLSRAYRMVDSGKNAHGVIHFISRGVMLNRETPKEVIDHVEEIANELKPVRLNAILVNDDTRETMLARPFMETLADRQSAYPNTTSIPGEVILIHRSEHSVLDLVRVVSLLGMDGPSTTTSFSYSASSFKTTPLLTISLPFYKDHEFEGVVGIDISLSDLADAVWNDNLATHSPPSSRVALFLVFSSNGLIVSSTWSESVGQLLWVAEEWAGDEKTVTGTFNKTIHGDNLMYIVKEVPDSPFSLVLRLRDGLLPLRIPLLDSAEKQLHSMDSTVYHRFELQPDLSARICSHWGDLSLPDKSSIFLPLPTFSPSSRPFLDSSQMASTIWVYLADRIGVIRSSILKEGIREEAGALARIAEEWMNRHGNGDRYIIRRYGATRSGVMVVFPANVVRTDYDPRKEAWYLRALTHQGRIVITGPYEHPQLGDVITLSTTILEGIKGSLHSKNNNVFGVIAVDIPATYLTRLLRETLTPCGETRNCLLLSDTGHVLSSDFPAEASAEGTMGRGAMERHHVAHVESRLALEMLNNSWLVRKSECLSGGVHRNLLFNTSFSYVHSIPCDSTKAIFSSPLYAEILLVQNTNVFLSLVDPTCPKTAQSAFCPCSVNDRRCLFCARFDSSECECPCQCLLTREQKCSSPDKLDSWPSLCTTLSPPPSSFAVFQPAPADLFRCFPLSCSSHATAKDCSGIAGCSWCSMDVGGRNLVTPFCTEMDRCYQGIRGNSLSKSSMDYSGLPSIGSNVPIGPVIAGIFCTGIFVGIIVFCCRNQNGISGGRCSNSTSPLFGRHQEAFFDDEPTAFLQEKVVPVPLASFERERPPIRPNRPPASESDPGYSTMTATGDDSDNATSVFPEKEQKERPSCVVVTSVTVHRVDVPSMVL